MFHIVTAGSSLGLRLGCLGSESGVPGDTGPGSVTVYILTLKVTGSLQPFGQTAWIWRSVTCEWEGDTAS